MASLDLPVETRMASFSRLVGMSLAAWRDEIHYPCGLGGVRRGLQQLHDFVQSFLILCGGHGIYVFLDFNDSLYIRQKGLQFLNYPTMVSGMAFNRKG